MTLKVAIIGCGKIADAHVEELQKLPRLGEIVAACDRESLMAEQLATRYGLPAHYDDLDAMLARERPDVVHITTPPGSHASIAARALDAGCHVYVEKPLTPTYEETVRLLEHARASKRMVTVGYTYYFDPPALEMRDLIAAGVVGEIVHLESCYGYNLAGPYGAGILADANHWVHGLPGKLFQNNIDHLLNKVTEFIDDEHPNIWAHGRVLRSSRIGDARDSMVDELRLAIVGSRVTAFGLFSAHARPTGHYLRVFGTENTLHVDFVERTVSIEGVAQLPSAIGRLVPPFARAAGLARAGLRNIERFARSDFQFFAGLSYLIQSFYASITEGKPPPIAERDMLRIARWMDEVIAQVPQQGDEGREVV